MNQQSIHNSTVVSECNTQQTTLPPTPNHPEPVDLTQESIVPPRRNRWRVRLEELRAQASNDRDLIPTVPETPNIQRPPSVHNSINSVAPPPSVHNSSINVTVPQNFLYEASNSSLINQSATRRPRNYLQESLDELRYRERQLNLRQREIDIRAQQALIDMRQRQARYYDLAGESSRLYNENLRVRNHAMALGSINY